MLGFQESNMLSVTFNELLDRVAARVSLETCYRCSRYLKLQAYQDVLLAICASEQFCGTHIDPEKVQSSDPAAARRSPVATP